uniref:Brain enriched myelin associated protein 1 n=2 Tax=Sarcophilus harrisii TaxID=9305 RepID=A0A7N4NST9_SARHA
MSFFKTLVSSNKAGTKTDSEDKGSKAEKVQDGPAGQKTTGEVQAKGAKKKNPESPRLGYAFRKFFRHKSSKETQSTSNTKGAEKSPASSANTKSDKATSSSPEAQGTQKNTKGLDSSAQQQTAASSESAKDGTKEKSPTSLPLGKLFWKKTSDSTEKAITPPEMEPAGPGQKNKEGSKDKKPTADQNKKGNKKDASEQVNSPDRRGAEKNSMQNGGDSKESPLKRLEKRQSLGGFFKGLGPKRMSDAEVQTDPVSIGPVGKSK